MEDRPSLRESTVLEVDCRYCYQKEERWVQVVSLAVVVVSFGERFALRESENLLRTVVSELKEGGEEGVHLAEERCSRYLLRKDRQPAQKDGGD